MRTIAATFVEVRAAEDARRRLFETSVHPDEVAVAPAAVATSDDGPIMHPRTIVAVLSASNAVDVRHALQDAGGQIVADIEVA
jgi:hypothetical protein